jgi:hypothetical protein
MLQGFCFLAFTADPIQESECTGADPYQYDTISIYNMLFWYVLYLPCHINYLPVLS